jgi:hypothetical protein
MLKMSYLTDVLTYFQKVHKLIDDAQYDELHLAGNMAISMQDVDWYAVVLDGLAEICGISAEELSATISQEHPLMETMYYSQIGMPEHINIVLNDLDD